MKNGKIKMRPWRQKGSKWGDGCPKIGDSYFRKKWFGVFGGCNGAQDVSKTGILIFGKNGLAFRGHVANCSMSIFGHFLFWKNHGCGLATFFQLWVIWSLVIFVVARIKHGP